MPFFVLPDGLCYSEDLLNSLGILILLLAIAVYGTFIWGVWGVFRRVSAKDPLGLRVIKISAAISKCLVIVVLSGVTQLHWVSTLVAGTLFVLSKWLFWRCVQENRKTPLSLAYSPDLPQHLVCTGPYRWVRHPFYVSYLIAYFAGALATGYPAMYVMVLSMLAVYYHAGRTEEGKFASSTLRVAYADYKARTGMFLPKWRTFLSQPEHQAAIETESPRSASIRG